MQRRAQKIIAVLTFAVAAMSGQSAGAATPCSVVAGVTVDLAPKPYLPPDVTRTLEATDRAEFVWNSVDREAIGWMRITDASGAELGWVPAGHEAVTCGSGN